MATPYGISSHLLVPVAPLSALLSAPYLTWQSTRYRVTFIYDTQSKTFVDGDGTAGPAPREIAIVVPKTVTPPQQPALEVTVRYRDCKEDVLVDSFRLDNPPLNAWANRYVLAGGQLDEFLNKVNKKVKSYLKQRINAGDGVPANFQIVLRGGIRGEDRQLLVIAGYLEVGATFMERLPVVPVTE